MNESKYFTNKNIIIFYYKPDEPSNQDDVEGCFTLDQTMYIQESSNQIRTDFLHLNIFTRITKIAFGTHTFS